MTPPVLPSWIPQPADNTAVRKAPEHALPRWLQNLADIPRSVRATVAQANDFLMRDPVVGGLTKAGHEQLAVLKTPQGRLDFAMGLPAPGVVAGITEIGEAAGRRAASNTGKVALAKVGFRSVSPEEALAMARRGDHLKQLPNGQYVGAPAGTNSPAKLGALRRAFDALVEGGELGLDWYPRARASVEEMAGPDPVRQQMTARSLGNFSSQANPDINLGFHLQAEEAYNAGEPRAIVRTGAQARKYNSARDAGVPVKLGPKQEPYVNKFDPTQDPNHIPTNDIWHGRSWGFTNPDGSPWSQGFSPSQHTWLDGETILAADRANRKRLLGRSDWNAASVQAAPWVYLKGTDLHARFPKRFPTLQDGINEAAKTYNDAFPKYTVFATHEAVPGAGTGHLPGLLDAPFREREAFSRAAPWADANGRDVLYDAVGTSQRPMNDATGYFTPKGGTPEINPASASRPMFGPAKDAQGSTLSPVAQGTLDQVEALRAFLDAQNTGAWHKVFPDAKSAVSTSLRIPLPRQLTEDEMKRLASVAEMYGFGISDTGDGVTLMNFGGADGAALKKALRGELGQELGKIFPGIQAERGRLVSNAIDFQDAFAAPNAGTGAATRRLLEVLDNPNAPAIGPKLSQSPAVRAKAAANAARDEAVAGQYGGARPDIQNARRIFSQEGLEGLRKALAAGVALPGLAALLGLGDEGDE